MNLISQIPQIKILFPFLFHQSLHPKSFHNQNVIITCFFSFFRILDCEHADRIIAFKSCNPDIVIVYNVTKSLKLSRPRPARLH